MTQLILEGYIDVPAQDLATVTAALPEHIRLTLEEPGCLTFTVSADEKVAGRFVVYERFVNRAAFEHHQRRIKTSYWGEVTQQVSRHYTLREHQN